MKLTWNKILKYLAFGIIAVTVGYFLSNEKKGSPRDYAAIATSKKLNVTTEYNSIGFHVEGDTLSGFYYDLIQAFALDHHLKVNIIPEMSFDKQLEGLFEGKYDIIANGILVTSRLKDSLLLTTPIILSQQVLVQRKPKSDKDSTFIRSQLDLAKKTLYIAKNSPSILRIHNLANEIGDTIYIKEIEKYGSEQLIALVAHGDIDYAVCDQDIARMAAKDIPQIDINTAISFTQFYSWGVSKKSPVLMDSLNTWLQNFRKSETFKDIYRKYYNNN